MTFFVTFFVTFLSVQVALFTFDRVYRERAQSLGRRLSRWWRGG